MFIFLKHRGEKTLSQKSQKYKNNIIQGVHIMQKKLYKIEEGKKLAGVCGGIAEYFNIDPTIVRLAWVLFSLCFGCGLIAYIVAAIIMPNKSDVEY